jgi:hypothetical protein
MKIQMVGLTFLNYLKSNLKSNIKVDVTFMANQVDSVLFFFFSKQLHINATTSNVIWIWSSTNRISASEHYLIKKLY